MTIKNKLFALATFSIVCVLALGVCLYRSAGRLNASMHKNNIAIEIARGAFDRRMFLNDYIAYGVERAKEQWLTAHAYLADYTDSQAQFFASSEEQKLVIDMQKTFGGTKMLFLEFVTIHDKNADGGATTITKDREHRLANQLLVISQSVVTTASTLAERSQHESTKAYTDIVYTLIGFISAIFLLTGFALFSLWKSIIVPLQSLQRGIALVRDGNLEYKVGTTSTDELGSLSRSFDAMTASVRQRTLELDTSNRELKTSNQELLLMNYRFSQAKARDEAILASIGDGLIATDDTGRIMYVNKAAETLLGIKGENVISKDVVKIFPMQDSKGTALPREKHPIYTTLTTGAMVTTDLITPSYYTTRKDKTRFPISITVTPVVLSGKIIGAIKTFRDITKETEIDKAKTEFVWLASHQLRTPLTATNWYSEMILNGDVGRTTAKQREYLAQIHSSNRRMIDLVNTLLDVSRLELGTFAIEKKPVDVIATVKEVLREQAMEIKEKKLLLTSSLDPHTPQALADPKLTRMILENLLSNAVKYTDKKGSIHIEISSDAQKKNVLITMQDSGCGIPKGQQEKIYEKLFRADNVRSKNVDGTGLGLYIVKSILDACGGTIRFDSVENKGTTFYITLPAVTKGKVD